MMLHHFNCPDRVFPGTGFDLIFSWDDETGEIKGDSAAEILATFKRGYTPAHPRPSSYRLTSTKNKTDLAAVVGDTNILPPELEGFYPVIESPDPYLYDEDGNINGQIIF